MINVSQIEELVGESTVSIRELKEGSFYVMFYNPHDISRADVKRMMEVFANEKIKILVCATPDNPLIFKVETAKQEAA